MKRTLSPDRPPYASTAQDAEALGVSVTTVKRWVDDGVLPAHRTPGGHRKLLLADVARLAREGGLPHADLARLDPRWSAGPEPDAAALSGRLAGLLNGGDGPGVRALVRAAYHGGMAVEDLADQVISPAMAAIGHDWESGRIDVTHEHRGTQLVAAAVYELKAAVERNAERGRPVAVGGAVERDHYLLPTLLAQMSLVDAGWEAVNLGPNTPFFSFRRALDEFRPRLVWVSVSYLADAAAFEREYRAFFRLAESRGAAVVLGGRALPDETRARLPYTAFGDGLAHLVAFARTLHPRPRPPKRGRPPGT
jgi:excisionase family DNA binding protein